jgi:hypothetical protein
MSTSATGVFPARCAVVVDTSGQSTSALLSNPNDLLSDETSVTIGEALKILKSD